MPETKSKESTALTAQLQEELRAAKERVAKLEERLAECTGKRERLESRRAKLWAMLHKVPIGVFESTPDGRLVYINDAVAEMLGYDSPEEVFKAVAQTSVAEVLYAEPELRGRFIEEIRASESGTKIFENRYRRKDGGVVEAIVTFSIFTDPDDGQEHLFGFVLDVTERNRAEEALNNSRQQFEQMLNIVPDMISIHDPEMNIVYSNWNGFAAVPPDMRIPGGKCYKIYRDHDDICPDCQARQVLETGLPFQMDLELPDGTWADLRVIPLLDDHGKVRLFMEWVRDITGKKQAEEALKASETRYRTILEASPISTIIHRNGIIKYVNAAGCAFIGERRPDDLIGRSIFDFVHPDYKAIVAKRLKRHQQGKFNRPKDVGIIHADGKTVYAQGTSVHCEYMGEPAVLLMAVDITERKIIEDALKASETRYRTILEASPISTIIHRNGIIEYVNAAGCAFLGERRPDDLIGNSVFDFVHPDYRDLALQRFERLGQGKANHPQDIGIVRRDGEVVYAQGTSLPFEYMGEPAALFMAVDITERKQAEENLKAREAELDSIFRIAPTGIGVVINRFITKANERFCEMIGYSREELLGQSARMLYPNNEEYEYVGTEKYRQIRERGTGTVETRFKRKDGRIIDVLLSSTPMNSDDLSAGVTFTALDITERKRSERELQEAKQDFELIFENSQVGIMLLRGGRVFARGNQRLADILGYATPGEMAGISMRQLHLSDEKFLHYGKTFYAKLAQGEQTQIEYQLRKKDGAPVWCILSGKAVDPADLDKGVIWVVDDLEPRKALEQALLDAKDAAEAASRAKSEFLANMSHEIRTPLNGIMGMLQLMQTTPLNAEQQEYALAAIQSSRRLTRLLSDILDLSRVEAGKLSVMHEPLDLPDTLRQVVELFQVTATQSGVKLTLHTDPGIPETVMGDAARLQQVLGNLVGNAFKFTQAGNVHVEAYPLPAVNPDTLRVLFSVSDTGIGIPDDKLDMLFESFTQAGEGFKRDYQGAGLGLAICKRLVGLMGGNMAVDSTPGRGTTIHFCISFGKAPVAPARKAIEKEPQDSLGQPMRVLLAEDDRVSRFTATRQLEKAGCAVTAVTDGMQALVALSRDDFDLVLMDVQMPNMDGVEATRAIRAGQAGAAKSGVPIVALTAYAMDGDKDKFLAAGMDGYLPKPVETDSLLEVLKQMAGRQVGLSRS